MQSQSSIVLLGTAHERDQQLILSLTFLTGPALTWLRLGGV